VAAGARIAHTHAVLIAIVRALFADPALCDFDILPGLLKAALIYRKDGAFDTFGSGTAAADCHDAQPAGVNEDVRERR
jgi:hypothetical protein